MKKIAIMIATVSLALTTIIVPSVNAATTYNDIQTSHRAYKSINYLAQGDITTSNQTGKFDPDAPMDRAHAAAMIGKVLQLNGTNAATKFPDVPATHFASGYINEAVTKGIISGVPESDGTFTYRPNELLTRGQMALLLSRAFGDNASNMNDAADELMEKGVAQGVSEGNFGLGFTMKRGDFAIFLSRVLNADFRINGNTEPATTMVVTADNLNFRTGPGQQFPAKKQFFTGYKVEVYYQIGDWYFAKGKDATGYFYKDYLSADPAMIASDITPQEPINLIPEEKKSFNELTIIVDPGHGGYDPGAIGFGMAEKNIVLDVSLKMKKYFQKTSLNVKLTRESDVFIPLSQRAAFAKNNNGDVFVSVHANALNGKANGQETYYYSASNVNGTKSKALATYIQKRMLEAWNLQDRGARYGKYIVLRENTVPSALAEIGFIDNKTDSAFIKSSQRREQIAKAITLGTLDYLYHYEGYLEAASEFEKLGAKPSIKHF